MCVRSWYIQIITHLKKKSFKKPLKILIISHILYKYIYKKPFLLIKSVDTKTCYLIMIHQLKLTVTSYFLMNHALNIVNSSFIFKKINLINFSNVYVEINKKKKIKMYIIYRHILIKNSFLISIYLFK